MNALVVNNKALQFAELDYSPRAKKDEVVVKVMCASLNPLDAEVMQGKYAWLLALSGSKSAVKTGIEFSGIVTAVDGASGRFREGDRVFGYVNLLKGDKTHQQSIVVNQDYLAHMPPAMSYEAGAALPLGALTSLVALRDVGGAKPGSRILIIGAAGGVGVYAVQVGKLLGAHVTAVAGNNDAASLMALGAESVLNYQHHHIASIQTRFDIVLDLSNRYPLKAIRHLLAANGRFIPAEPNKHVHNLISSLITRQKTKYLMVDRGNYTMLSQIAEWVAQGKLKVLIDKVFDLKDFQQALDRLDEKGKLGRIVLRVSEDG